MPRYYYTCPVKTFYMMDNFGVEIIHPECSYALASKAINFIEYFLFKHGKIYVEKDSEKIFKPINYDLAQFTRDDGISTIAQYDEVKKAFINGNFRILKKYNPIIIMRDNKQFFMPEVEKKYIAVIDKNFGVIFPDFLGCVSVGDNIDDAKIKAQEVLKFHIQGMREDGEELPTPKSLEEVKKEYPNQIYLIIEIC